MFDYKRYDHNQDGGLIKALYIAISAALVLRIVTYSFTYFSKQHFYMVAELKPILKYNSKVFLGRCPCNTSIIKQ